jgi:uncharacterized membrane protein
MNGKITQFLFIALLLCMAWRSLSVERRKSLHRYSQISATVLLLGALAALVVHWL